MPNWTYNELSVVGKCNLLDYLSVGKNGYKYFDFNKIISEPGTVEECIAKYGVEYIDEGDKHLEHNGNKDWFNWYKWHVDFWGTKWNSCDTEICDKIISFSTAWTSPEPVFKKLSELNPDDKFYVYSDYEDGGRSETTYQNGKIIESFYKE